MKFNVNGVSVKDGTNVFSMQTFYVPRQNEELEIDGYVYVVKYVRYNLTVGNFSTQNVQLGLARK